MPLLPSTILLLLLMLMMSNRSIQYTLKLDLIAIESSTSGCRSSCCCYSSLSVFLLSVDIWQQPFKICINCECVCVCVCFRTIKKCFFENEREIIWIFSSLFFLNFSVRFVSIMCIAWNELLVNMCRAQLSAKAYVLFIVYIEYI